MTHLEIGVTIQQLKKCYEAIDQLQIYWKSFDQLTQQQLFSMSQRLQQAKVDVAYQITSFEKREKITPLSAV
jgi:hypothetical protein